jgi:HEAT repeat protein
MLCRFRPRGRTGRVLLFWLFGMLGMASTSVGQPSEPLQHAWEVQPDLGDCWILSTSPRAAFLDVEKLNAPTVQERIDTAQMICLNHDRDGFQGGPQAIAILLKRLSEGKEGLLVKRAMMSAVCLLDDGSNASMLWEVAQLDPVMQSTVERAMLRWHSSVALATWRARLHETNANPGPLADALRGIAVVGETTDREALVGLLLSNNGTDNHRLLAAEALGAIDRSGLNALAKELLASNMAHRQVLAACLLMQHTDADALAILQTILNQSDPDAGGDSARRKAATALATHHPASVLDNAPRWLQDPDSHLRRLALEAMSQSCDEDQLRLQAQLLSDPSLPVREQARKNLLGCARSGARQAVDDRITDALQSNDWRALEQSLLLIAALKDASRCEGLLPLLEHPQPEVHLHAGWALMVLAEAPNVLEGMLQFAQSKTERLERGDSPLTKSESICLSFLLESFGRNRYQLALPMLDKYIPKEFFKMGNLCRASAIWSIGQIKKDVDDPGLRARLRERITDLPPMNPENFLVRFACILALGEFGYGDSIEILQSIGSDGVNPLGLAAAWAMGQIEKKSP